MSLILKPEAVPNAARRSARSGHETPAPPHSALPLLLIAIVAAGDWLVVHALPW